MGITSISAMDFVLGNFGILPDCILMAFVGSFLSSISQIGNASDGLSHSQKRSMLIYTICGTLVAIILFIWVTVLAKREFHKMSAELRLGGNSGKIYDAPTPELNLTVKPKDNTPQSNSNTR